MLRLIIGNKAYSSWSVRPWLFLRQKQVEFEETLVPFDTPQFHEEVSRSSPSKRVPTLVIDGKGEAVWDTLAIGEYLAETFPNLEVWPTSPRLRRLARCACAEMHSGFTEMRRVLTCNVRKRYQPDAWRKLAGGREAEKEIEADIARIHEIWTMMLDASNGPFLGGAFSYVDAYFAPVVSRFVTYGIESPARLQAYRQSVVALPSYQRWMEEAAREPWTRAKYEYDLPLRTD